MRATGPPLTLPLFTISDLGDVSARSGIAYMVENPPVFRFILSRISTLPPEPRPMVLCTSGQLSIAARKLLDLLVRGGAIIRYSGDFDPGGLAIARGLVRRYGEAVRLWRMDTAAHARALSPVGMHVDMGKLRTLTADFPELCNSIISRGVAYQESIVELLAENRRRCVVGRLSCTVSTVPGCEHILTPPNCAPKLAQVKRIEGVTQGRRPTAPYPPRSPRARGPAVPFTSRPSPSGPCGQPLPQLPTLWCGLEDAVQYDPRTTECRIRDSGTSGSSLACCLCLSSPVSCYPGFLRISPTESNQPFP
jgi:hypothetical protein